jgi:hypothetical protein
MQVAAALPLPERAFQQTSVEQKAQFGKLLRPVFPKVFNHSR